MGIFEQIQQDIEAIKAQNQDILEKLESFPNSEPEIVNIDGLIKHRPFLKSKAKIYAMVNRRAIPYHRQGRNLLFKLSEVDEFLTSKDKYLRPV